VSDRVSCTIDGGIADVRLNRPEKRNAIDREMLRAIIDTGERVAADPSVRVVVFSGEGKGFCAGLDRELLAASADPNLQRDDRHAQFTGSIREDAVHAVMVWHDLPAPVIAAVHGAALGGGFQLALGADIRVVAPDAQLGVFEIRWGIVPDMGGTQLLPPLVGPDVAKELMFTSRLVSGDEAKAIGLATRLAPDPLAAAFELAADIAGRNPDAIRVIKRLVDSSWGMSLDNGLRAERDLTEDILGSPNQVEAVRANLEQRPGNFA
jgi:enoyl-CoA hydratase/carnithine racemase